MIVDLPGRTHAECAWLSKLARPESPLILFSAVPRPSPETFAALRLRPLPAKERGEVKETTPPAPPSSDTLGAPRSCSRADARRHRWPVRALMPSAPA